MSKPRFLLDEHINRAIQRQLRRWNVAIEVLAVGDEGAPSSGTTDFDILRWIEANGYILVTENRRTMPTELAAHFDAGGHIPGVFWIRPGVSISEVVETLHLMWEASSAREYVDQALFIPL
ncbi:MAG: DUF5615 family PIN-like protein [Deltaproteobacteria bacterium]|nr:DUF5615 family PIN-like protein [Deltaproteobacteria bacterium]